MPTVLQLLKTAAIPLGKVMYIYGGGWNYEDTGAGQDCLSYGLSQRWVSFAANAKGDYDYRSYSCSQNPAYSRLGLDCSGYVGWVMYNLFGGRGYVFKSTRVTRELQRLLGGTITPAAALTAPKPGDILSSVCSCCSHVYINLVTCKDGSRVILHSSPPGVQLAATVDLQGRQNSMAMEIATYYMYKFYPKWCMRFPPQAKPVSYLTHYEALSLGCLQGAEQLNNIKPDSLPEYVFYNKTCQTAYFS